jgi:hypothetical protein
VQVLPRDAEPLTNRVVRRLRRFFVVGRHTCGESVASTEAAMASRGGLLLAEEVIPESIHEFSYGSLPVGTYWICLYAQRAGDDARALALAQTSAVVSDSRYRPVTAQQRVATTVRNPHPVNDAVVVRAMPKDPNSSYPSASALASAAALALKDRSSDTFGRRTRR